jgi:quercetin dioxygenase-like cupin family protein
MTMRAGEVYEHPGERLVVRVGTAESQGRELIVDLYVPGHAPGVPPHLHPQMEEALTVISGTVEVMAPDGAWRIFGPGERVVVPANTAHSWRPVGEDVRILGEARPGARFEDMWRQFLGLSLDGKLGPNGDHLPFLQAMAMIREFPDVMALAGPPIALQHVLAALCGPIARLSGYRGSYAEYLRRGPSEIVDLEPLRAPQVLGISTHDFEESTPTTRGCGAVCTGGWCRRPAPT